ncbi:hypothetical protein QUF64_07025 [Anaerolineales bacterium HSG6]|nr:hypothetical protein [Anaerolineales bacterium HSG6]
MFGELTDLLSKKFAVSYLLPVTLFVMVSYGIMSEFKAVPTIPALGDDTPELVMPDNVTVIYLFMDDMETNTDEIEVFVMVTIIGFLLWGGGFMLLAMNRFILRVMEGYGKYNPFRILDRLGEPSDRFQQNLSNQLPPWLKRFLPSALLTVGEKKRLEKLKQEIAVLGQQGDSRQRDRLLRKQRQEFPEKEDRLLPTSFGNAIRAFEEYSRLMYGLDAIPGWNHLQAVITPEFSQLVNDTKASVDFWANVWFLSWFVLVEYIVIVGFRWYNPVDGWGVVSAWLIPWFIMIVLLFVYFCFFSAKNAAILWGYWVKASFDVFIPELRQKLELPKPATREAEREMWVKFSQAIIYRHPASMPERDTEL